jgi:allantoin racemase
MTIRIWHQSFADLSQLPGYATMLAEHATASCAPGTTVGVHGVSPGTFPDGIPPVHMHHYRWAKHLITIQIVENAIRAEKDGYDAFALSCFIDPGVDLARSVVSIPVISSLETSLILAGTVGTRFGMITLDRDTAAAQWELVRGYGAAARVLALEPLDPPVTETDLDAAFTGSPLLVERFRDHAERLVAAGADVIVPAEGLLNTIMTRHQLREVLGSPVLDSYGGLLNFAEMLVGLRRRSGLATGRRAAYARPADQVLEHLRAVTASALGHGRLPTAASAQAAQ